MPTLTQADELDFVRRQVLTSRNVTGGRLVDWGLGGLNYQIEHHLFPNLPRPNLRHAQPLIRAFCHQHGLAYAEASLVGSYAQALRHLHTVGAPYDPTNNHQPTPPRQPPPRSRCCWLPYHRQLAVRWCGARTAPAPAGPARNGPLTRHGGASSGRPAICDRRPWGGGMLRAGGRLGVRPAAWE
jgi:hypothetical protein